MTGGEISGSNRNRPSLKLFIFM